MKLLIRIPPTPRGCGFPAHANEDWYAMHSPQFLNKKVRIITREMWLEY